MFNCMYLNLSSALVPLQVLSYIKFDIFISYLFFFFFFFLKKYK
jgi:hypothetical protein